jgi:hypothetical protein
VRPRSRGEASSGGAAPSDNGCSQIGEWQCAVRAAADPMVWPQQLHGLGAAADPVVRPRATTQPWSGGGDA